MTTDRDQELGGRPGPSQPPSAADALALSVPAEADQLTAIRQAACAFAEQHRVGRPVDVALAVGEACANVITHAYRDRSSGPLHLSGDVDAERVYLAVADEGSGLAAHPRSPGFGLGLPIIARVTDHFEITQRAPSGTTVVMGFARAPAAAGPTAEGRELLAQARRDVAESIAHGRGLRTVEQRIDETLSADARDGLWLFAWASVELEQRRREPRSS